MRFGVKSSTGANNEFLFTFVNGKRVNQKYIKEDDDKNIECPLVS